MAFTPQQLRTPLLHRPYDLRHSGVTWRLNSGVPATEIAAWAGHSVEMLMRVYARCVVGMEDVWITRMDATLRPDGGPAQDQSLAEQAPGAAPGMVAMEHVGGHSNLPAGSRETRPEDGHSDHGM